ncbi:type VI secretion system lipoprotein TssJ [Metapseudomonas boanensis]|uniref:Type VI secretion system lipoprotein TssJ n=1 Tax=Metapseudomonas boanensis TaxID=2822138 RepID=A0ABS5XJ45_9GAMM|nr:type VI secretion system lipoprotein TssJ [Pseudomonas boanensis]MBT8767701.1 type VI secretion system lipoprotein TssJ [Pseudomonas boanensis]
MLRTVFKSLLLTLLVVLVGGCGLYQSVGGSSASFARSIFYKQVKTLHLDFSGRTAMNTDTHDMYGLSVPTLVRIYVLRDDQAFRKASYDSLVEHSLEVLGADLLDERTLVISPDEGAQLRVPLDEAARVVAVAALFRQPDTGADSWRLVLTRDDLDPDQARVIELADNRLNMRPLPED